VAALLVEDLAGKAGEAIDRLSIRVGCRTAEWPKTLEDGLTRLWGKEAVGVYELAPLRRVDVLMAAEDSGLNSDTFLRAVDGAEAVPLAIKPVTLEFLLDSYPPRARRRGAGCAGRDHRDVSGGHRARRRRGRERAAGALPAVDAATRARHYLLRDALRVPAARARREGARRPRRPPRGAVPAGDVAAIVWRGRARCGASAAEDRGRRVRLFRRVTRRAR
jgi:hypothetical protein